METVTIQDLIDRHLKGAAECEAYAATDMPDKGNAKTYRARAEWHKAAAALLQSVPTTVDLANADADGFRNGRASVVVELGDSDLRKDAERYRWLRDKAGSADWEYVGYQSPETTNSEIDQWMKERPNG